MRRTAAVLVSVVMTLSCGSTAFAAIITHDIFLDNLVIDSDNNNKDGYIVISSGESASHHQIIVNGVTTTITLDNVDIETVGESAIDIGDDANVNLVINGENNLTVTGFGNAAGIHVSGGSLTISGTDADDDILTVLNTGSNGATIGSNFDENFTGTITIDGGVTVNAGYYDINDDYYIDGAGIGSGVSGDMNGTIIINEGSVVYANAVEDGAGIGSGDESEMNGTIIINGGDVYAYSGWDGAGIGSGYNSEMKGTIIINGGNVSAISQDGGAGIGSGEGTEMSGTIEINGGTVSVLSKDEGAGIGAGGYSNMSGTIEINSGNVNAEALYGGAAVGTGYYGYVSGDIIIHGSAVVSLEENNIIGSYNQSEGTIYLYKGATINGITVSNEEDLKAAGILNDNMKVEILEEEEPSQGGHSYSLGKLTTTSRIKSAKTGDKVYVYESELSKGKLPYYVLETLSKTDNVTLVVVGENGETVEINSSNVPEKGKKAFYTVDELLDMAK